MSKDLQVTFPEPVTRFMVDLIHVHSIALTIGALVMTIVTYSLWMVMANKLTNTHRMPGETALEITWTVLPFFILLVLAFPSMRLLYAMDEMLDPKVTIKIVGHQWYWHYEYGDFAQHFEYDSYMKGTADLVPGDLRLMEVDKPMIVPFDTSLRLLVTGGDVIHSWTILGSNLKSDACPGRLNQMNATFHSGIYFGACSEHCGVNHAFMPIVVEAVPMEGFLAWADRMVASEVALAG